MDSNLSGNIVNRLATQHQNFKGRRITNAGDAVAAQDYVTLKQTEGFLSIAKSLIPVTIPLAKITVIGANGSIVIDSKGNVTYTLPT
jgi:hypothetical protein